MWSHKIFYNICKKCAMRIMNKKEAKSMESDAELIFLRAGITDLINSTNDADILDLVYKILVAERCSLTEGR